jgi:hypothetical protein
MAGNTPIDDIQKRIKALELLNCKGFTPIKDELNPSQVNSKL